MAALIASSANTKMWKKISLLRGKKKEIWFKWSYLNNGVSLVVNTILWRCRCSLFWELLRSWTFLFIINHILTNSLHITWWTYRFSFDPFGGQWAWCNSRAASKRFKFCIDYFSVFVNLNLIEYFILKHFIKI